MPIALDSLTTLRHLPFDDIIDVRTPDEFAEDHIPGAINLPVLSNAERARVGTIYVQEDRFLARKIGAALVSRNAAAHLEGPLADRSGGWRPLVYCWRGGQRSGSFTVILQQIGWQADTIAGGYQTYRRLVSQALYEQDLGLRLVLIDGGTGTAKTRLLWHLADEGAQMLDLEGLAAHRGSVFGPVVGGQPAQKGFESALAAQLVRFDPLRPIFVEAESPRIGRINLPPALTKAMQTAPAVRLEAPLTARVAHICEEYADLIDDTARLDSILAQLIRYHGHEQVTVWRALAASGDFAQLVRELIEVHYDPRYTRINRSAASPVLRLPDLTGSSLRHVARQLIETT
ncbi:tRNA 2-selenouridine(34) synthase MnmH [uncultured Roseovarius sp.]|uniref:tRNA 2-selenouridine(34) synthase MnmH n=1 Tax=uncultured Roseovarius sp. TaxID=293344 RepID=UPI002627B467|nr:tRNA 2-selenouridine(34) synthase MnmH [uncultured Roseovarius sp.]